MKVASNGVTLHVEEQGRGGLSLVFLHYWGGSSRTWKHVTARLAGGFHTLAIDHRGWGESEAPAHGYALADLAADADGVIQALGLRRYVLVGHSMGGKVAQLMASRGPAGLAGLVLVAPSPPRPMTMPEQARKVMTIDHVLTAKPLAPDDREQVIRDSLRGAPPAKLAWPNATSLEDITAAVGAIAVPTLVIAGELDRVDSPDLLKADLLSRVPHAVMEVLPGTGHLSPLESPDAVADLIEHFCSALKEQAG